MPGEVAAHLVPMAYSTPQGVHHTKKNGLTTSLRYFVLSVPPLIYASAQDKLYFFSGYGVSLHSPTTLDT